MSSVKRKLLIVEDDPGLQGQLRWSFDGCEVEVADDRDTALAQIRRHEPQVVTLDLGLPPDPGGASEGLATLEEILSLLPTTKVIVVTGNDDHAHAVEAVARGAYDYYQKPVDAEMLGLIVERGFKLHELERENKRLSREAGDATLSGIICGSPEMLSVCRTVEKVAPTEVTTLVLGESGTGKELIARSLHDLSNRSEGPFVAINCAAIPEQLLESELFGYEKGAFTGAVKQTRGKIEYADGGTFFLDEVGDLPMALQAKLLRFLQERKIERVGGRKEIPVDVRVVCATHQKLADLIEQGRFREDLFYRVSEVTVRVPPLRERQGDSVVLARSFLEKTCEQHDKRIRGFSPEALVAIESYAWPGNVRELENRIKRAVIMADGKMIVADDLELDASQNLDIPLNLREVREQAEQQAILRALSLADGNVSQTAEMLGITRPTLYSLMNKYDLKA